MNKEQELKKQIEEIKNTNRHSRNKIMKEIKSKLNPIEIEIMDLASKGLQLEAELKGIQSQKAKEKEFIRRFEAVIQSYDCPICCIPEVLLKRFREEAKEVLEK